MWQQDSKATVMWNEAGTLLEHTIQLELKAAELYLSFSGIFNEDKQLWQQLALEEKNHAALLRSAERYFGVHGNFPSELFYNNIAFMQALHEQIEEHIRRYIHEEPTRLESFNLALSIETSAAEAHFQQQMQQKPRSREMEILQRLNKDDKDHAHRIRKYMHEHGIEEKNTTT